MNDEWVLLNQPNCTPSTMLSHLHPLSPLIQATILRGEGDSFSHSTDKETSWEDKWLASTSHEARIRTQPTSSQSWASSPPCCTASVEQQHGRLSSQLATLETKGLHTGARAVELPQLCVGSWFTLWGFGSAEAVSWPCERGCASCWSHRLHPGVRCQDGLEVSTSTTQPPGPMPWTSEQPAAWPHSRCAEARSLQSGYSARILSHNF